MGGWPVHARQRLLVDGGRHSAGASPDDRHVLLTWVLRAFIAVATVHVLLLDPVKQSRK
ncbi:hypothetical protein ACFU53_12740 [Streptomyces sp. NPDC057474]|uniref:hypothetical protein n=1 Tax=Streptomyces sp. NPDC057474 TaxID=3346144 RepID=UPI0036D1950D